ncbi:MAG: glycosyltransferase family 2 protein [Oscillospiraceae bacterium]|nr:glycosyltransferase family 2 protein [Oscillospiraceae bacterium]
MKASIIIPNLNGEKWIKESIDTCINQNFDQEYEIIIIENASTDRSLEIIEECATRFKNFHIIKNETNLGFAPAVNQGIRLSTGEYAVMFNNDAFAEPDWLAELVRVADSDPNIFSVGSLMIQHFNRDLADDAGDYVPLFGWTCKRGDGLSWKRYQKQERIFSACGGAALYRRSILEEIGYFEEAFFAYGEDVDLGWRANNRGYKNIYNPKAICYHICSATTGGRYNAFKAVKSGQNNALLLYKNQPLLMLLINLPFILIGFLPKYLMYRHNGFDKELMEGTRNAFRMKDDIIKPKFRLKNLPNYLWVEWKMFVNCFTYVDYRVKRFLKIK